MSVTSIGGLVIRVTHARWCPRAREEPFIFIQRIKLILAYTRIESFLGTACVPQLVRGLLVAQHHAERQTSPRSCVRPFSVHELLIGWQNTRARIPLAQ